MTDAALRAAERRLIEEGTDEARAAWIAAHLRAGGRDPRLDPRGADVVIVGGQALTATTHDGRTIVYASPLDVAEMRSVSYRVVTRWGEGREATTPVAFGDRLEWTHPLLERKGPWLMYGSHGKRERDWSTSLATWRRWARRGTVLRLGPEEKELMDREAAVERLHRRRELARMERDYERTYGYKAVPGPRRCVVCGEQHEAAAWDETKERCIKLQPIGAAS